MYYKSTFISVAPFKKYTNKALCKKANKYLLCPAAKLENSQKCIESAVVCKGIVKKILWCKCLLERDGKEKAILPENLKK